MDIAKIWNIFKQNNECIQENAAVHETQTVFILNKHFILCWLYAVTGDFIITHKACSIVLLSARKPVRLGGRKFWGRHAFEFKYSAG